MKHRIATAAIGLALLGACTPSQVNQSIADAQSACATLPADAAAAQAALKGGAAGTATEIADKAAQACNAVNTAAANESVIDSTVSVLDGWWEDVFGAKTAAAPAATAPAPAATAPAVTAPPATPAAAPASS